MIFLKVFLNILSYAKGLSKRELRPFRQALLNESSTRFCAKRMQVNCNSNGDKDITLDEWRVCVGVQKGTA